MSTPEEHRTGKDRQVRYYSSDGSDESVWWNKNLRKNIR